MYSTYDIICTIGLSAFMGISLWLALEIPPFYSRVSTPIKKESPSNTELLFNPSHPAVLYGENDILRIKHGSANHRFIRYLFEHEGQDILIEQLYRDLKLPEDTYIKKLIANTKLPKEVRDQAFVVRGNTVHFKASFN